MQNMKNEKCSNTSTETLFKSLNYFINGSETLY